MSEATVIPATADVASMFAGRTACSLLVEWANKQDHWVRWLVGEVIASREELADGTIDQAYRAYRAEKGLDAGEIQTMPALPEAVDTVEQVEPLCLTSLDALAGVNALAANQIITFHPKLTVLFGENATGKTGYVRILKSVANVRTAEPVLGNVRSGSSDPKQSARLRYRLGASAEATHTWTGETGVAPFTRMYAFDTRAVAIHVDEDLVYTYTPRDLALYRYVAEAIDGVKERLERDRVALIRPTNPFVSRFDRAVSFYTKLETLGPVTTIAELHQIANEVTEDEAGRNALRERVDLLRSQSIEANLQLAKNQAALGRMIEDVAGSVLAFNAEAYNSEVKGHAAAAAAHHAITDEAFAGSSIPGVLGTTWREMIDAAHRYTTEAESTTYPHDGDACVYCRQSLAAPAIDLLKKYRDLSTAVTRRVLDEAREALEKRKRTAPDAKIPELQSMITQNASFFEADKVLANVVGAMLTAATEAATVVRSGSVLLHDTLYSAATAAKELGATATAKADILVADLSGKADERKRLLLAESARLRELEGRLLLRQLLPEIEEYVGAAKAVSLASALGARFAPLQKSLTDATKEASVGLLNEDFEKRFRAECGALNAPAVTLDFPGRKGEAARRKSVVPRHKLSEILSEGEQKVIALADFLAEATLRRTSAPVVFDDPVNSLDYRRSDYVAARVVDLAADQQVIVFTHNIMLTVALLEIAKARGVALTYYDIKADDGKIGLVSEGSSPRVDSTKAFEKRIETAIEKAGAETGEMREMWIERGYSLMRSWCEVFVEVDLFKGVARRWEPNVRLHSLPNIKPERLGEAIKAVSVVFNKANRDIDAHSQTLESLSIRPTLDELKGDYKSLLDAREAYTKK